MCQMDLILTTQINEQNYRYLDDLHSSRGIFILAAVQCFCFIRLIFIAVMHDLMDELMIILLYR